MGGETVILDSSNLDAIIKDATGEGLKVEVPVPEPIREPPKETPKPVEEDDTEDENGLTAHQKKELTQKMQIAIGKKHRALKEAEEFAAEQYNERRLAEGRAEAYEREIQRLKAQVQPKEADGKPQRENFETEEKYRDALDDWRVDQKFKAREAAARAEREREVMEAAKAHITAALEIVPDFQEVTESVDYIVPPNIAGFMQESPLFAELGYHFAKHPEDLAHLAILPDERAKLEFRKLESNIQPFASVKAPKANGKDESPPSEPPKAEVHETAPVPSKPRAPVIKPLSAGSATQVEKPPSERTLAEEKAAWQRKHRVNLDRRQRH